MPRQYTADQIEVLESDKERVRRNASMYVPDIYETGWYHMLWELVSNSIDELTAPGSTSNKLDIFFNKDTHEIGVDDNGAGIPLEKLLDVLTKLAASGKFNNGSDNSAYQSTSGRWGHGLKALVFLSKSGHFTSMRDGKYLTYYFKDGEKVDEKSGKSDKHGTSCRFIVDSKLIDDHAVNVDEIINKIKFSSCLFPDLKITFHVIDKKGKETITKYGGKDIEDRVKAWKPDTPIMRITTTQEVTYLKSIVDDKLTTDKVGIDIAFAYGEKVLDGESSDYIITAANAVDTYAGGAHLDGFKAGIQKYFKEKIIPKFRGKDKELNILPSDTINGVCAFISVKVVSPIYDGQAKTRLANQEVKIAVREAVYDYLCNLKSTTQMVDFVKRVTRGRMASKKTRKKDVSNAFSKDRLENFKDIIQNLKTTDPECILVEGLSAGDNAAQARDPYNQAIYPIRRPANIFDQDTSSVEKLKTTFNDVLDICGLSVGDKCDPEKSTMNRILMLTDGDVDGDDIAISTVCLLAKHCKPLVDAGMVGRILPPAYAIPIGKGKKQYVRSQREFFDYILKDFVKNHKVSYKGKEMTKKDLRQFLEKNFEYDIEIDRLKDRYCCDPKFIEYLAWNYHGHQKDQKKSYWMNKLKPYPYLSIIMEKGDKGNILVLDGDYPGFDYLNLALDEYFDRHINRFKEMQKMNDTITGYTLDGKKNCTVYDVMHAMRSSIPGGKIERFKGLGELSPDEMRDLCMDKDKRTVAIFKFNDFKKDMDKINIIMSTKKEFVEARAKLMSQNRLDWKDLDT